MTTLDQVFELQRFSVPGLAALEGAIANPGSDRPTDMMRALPEGVEEDLLVSCALARCAQSGIHIEDVHFDARAAFEQFALLPKDAAAPFFKAKGLAGYETELLRLKQLNDRFAKAMGLPDKKAQADVSERSSLVGDQGS